MKSDEQNSLNGRRPWWRRINLEFYYMEKVGSRYYLRVTPFFWIMIILSLVFFFGFLLYQKYQEDKEQNFASPPAQTSSPTQSPSTSTQRTFNQSSRPLQTR